MGSLVIINIVTVFLLGALLPHLAQGDQVLCSFPPYLRARPRWEAQLSLERRVIGAFWSFNERTLETIDLTKSEQVPTVYTCSRVDQQDRFVVTFSRGQSTSTQFLCLQFIQRSPYVIQVMRSKTSSTSDRSDLCADSSLIMDSSPLVWPQPDQFIPIPSTFVGGFQFTLTDHATDFDLCQTATLLPSWEADCMAGDGITIDFRQFQCRGDLGMELVETLFNLGSWEQGNHVFAVVTNLDELWPKIWLLRAPITPANPNVFDIDIFSSVLITETPDMPDSSAHYTFRMKRLSYTTQCSDEALSCGSCDPNTRNINCLKTCQQTECQRLANQPACNFPTTSRGEWIEVSYSGTKSINISAQSIQAQTQRKLSCLDLKTEVWFEDGSRRTVMTLFDNGCRPRYQCAEFHRRSDAVLQYQMSDATVWPQPLPMNPGQLCASEKFDVIKKSVVQNELHPFRWKALIKASPENAALSSVSCGLTGRLYLMMHTAGKETCLGSIDSCKGNPSQFEFNKGAQCGGTFITISHTCIAAFSNEKNDDKILITRSVKPQPNNVDAGSTTALPATDNYPEFLCWVFHKGEWDFAPRLYLTQASDCHTDIANDIAYRNFTGYLAQIDLAAGPGPLGNYECSANTDNPFASITTKKPATQPSSGHPEIAESKDESAKLAASALVISVTCFAARVMSR